MNLKGQKEVVAAEVVWVRVDCGLGVVCLKAQLVVGGPRIRRWTRIPGTYQACE
jgi:hypothetical protein